MEETQEIYDYDNILATIATEVDIIIDRHAKVDFHDNPEVHRKISQEIDGLIYC